MPSASVKLVPGVNTDKTPSLNEAGISASNLIRFREGLVEKRGGWSTFLAAAVAGIPRAVWAWRDFTTSVFLAIGTTTKLLASTGGVARDITPRQQIDVLTNCFSTVATTNPNIRVTDANFVPATGDTIVIQDIFTVAGLFLSGPYVVIGLVSASVDPTPSFSIYAGGALPTAVVTHTVNYPTYATTMGSPVVTVSLAGHGQAVGKQFVITNPVTVGGVTLRGAYTINAVVDTNTFTFQLNTLATSAGSFTTSSVSILYQTNPKIGAALMGTPVTATDWSLGNYGQLLIACAAGGNIYQWQTNGAYQIATVIANSPQASGILISDAAQQIVAYGGNPNSLYDPNYVAWSDTGNINQWTAAVGNQAGSYRIPTGSGIVGAATVASGLILLWTDVDVWSMQYVGYPTVYGFTKIATGCGLLGQFAWARLGGNTYWMSQKKFWVYDGQTVQPLDCPVYDSVFPLLSPANAWKVRGGSNAAFNEVMWFFPSASGTGENDSYVCFNPAEGTWDIGTMARSAWVDQSVAGLPIGADPSGNVFQHETSPDAAGAAMPWSFTTGLFQIAEGEDFAFIDRIRPDFRFPQGAGTVQVSVLTYKYPSDAPVLRGPYSFTAATEYITTRCRGRYVALTFSGNDTGSFWRIGRTQFRFQPDGRR